MIKDGMLNGITDSMVMILSKPQEMVKDREAWHAAVMGSHRVRHDKELSSSHSRKRR